MGLPVLKTFKMDRLARNSENIPVGRVVIAGEYVEGEDIAVAVMELLTNIGKSVRGEVFYIDGFKYKLPPDFPDLKITNVNGKLMVNSFYLMKVRDE